MRLHTDLIANSTAFYHLLFENRLQVNNCESSRLYAHDLCLLSCALQILIDQPRYLSGFTAAGLASDQDHLIFGDGVKDGILLSVDGQFSDVAGYSAMDVDLRVFGIDKPFKLNWKLKHLWLLLLWKDGQGDTILSSLRRQRQILLFFSFDFAEDHYPFSFLFLFLLLEGLLLHLIELLGVDGLELGVALEAAGR